jgi:hypothetical protein
VERCVSTNQVISGVTLQGRDIERALLTSSWPVRIKDSIIVGPLWLSDSVGRAATPFEVQRLCRAAAIPPPRLCERKATELPALLSEIDIRSTRFVLGENDAEILAASGIVLRQPLRLVNVSGPGDVRLRQVVATAPVVIERSTLRGGIHIADSVLSEGLRIADSSADWLSVNSSALTQDLDATGAELRRESFVNQSLFQREWILKGARMGGLVIGNTTVHGTFDVSGARVRQTGKEAAIWFHDNQFRGPVRFVDAAIDGRTSIYARFVDDADFTRTVFNGTVSMTSITFCKKVTFADAIFGDTTELRGGFLGKAILSRTNFLRGLNLGGYFRQGLDGHGASFGGGLQTQGVRIEGATANDLPTALVAAGVELRISPIPEADLQTQYPECYP